MKKAIVLGGTGMVGTQLVQLLLENDSYSEIVSLTRRASGMNHPKFKEQIIDFNNPDSWSNFVNGDVLFSALGTTIVQAKTKENQYKVDYSYQYTVAAVAARNGIPNYVLISSASANANAKMFYLNMKGKLEDAVKALPFKVISIIRPGILAGTRTKIRAGEIIGISALNFLNQLGLFKRYKPIQAYQVAQAMINAAEMKKSESYSLEQVFELAK